MPSRSLLILTTATLMLAACSRGNADVAPQQDREPAGMMERDSGQRMDGGMMGDRGSMMGEMMGNRGSMADMASIRGLLAEHESIERRVENIPGGVRTVTISDDPEAAALIRRHVREMRARYERDQPIRMMDPVFRELYRHRDRATMKIEDIPGGVRVIHTSDDPQVTMLIRQHARHFVSEAAEQGMERAMRPTPLPKGYGPAE